MFPWKQVCGILAAGACLVGLAGTPEPAAAQQAAAPQAAAPAAAAQPQRPVFRARDLMTAAERQSYRQAMRAARTDPARKRQLREQWTSTLNARAAQRGGVLARPAFVRPSQNDARNNKPSAQRQPNRSANPPPRAP